MMLLFQFSNERSYRLDDYCYIHRRGYAILIKKPEIQTTVLSCTYEAEDLQPQAIFSRLLGSFLSVQSSLIFTSLLQKYYFRQAENLSAVVVVVLVGSGRLR